MSLLEAALQYARRGIPVFPLEARTKKPLAGSRGFHDATTDAEVVRAWWAEDPDRNIGFQPHLIGLAIIDLDGREAREEWEALQVEHGQVPDTWTVQTPRGTDHLHLYFRGALPGSVGRLGPGIDTRGIGSYALLPPSRVGDGSYEVVQEVDYAPLPGWVLETLDKSRRATAATTSELDQPHHVTRARQHASRAEPAVESEGGDERTFRLACDLRDLGVSEETALAILTEEFNPRCVPPWEPADLEEKVANAFRYAQNAPGAWAAPSLSEAFGPVLDTLDLKPAAAERSRFEPRTLEELAALPPPSFLVEDMIPAGGLTLFYGQMGSYKSFLVLDQAMTLAHAGMEVVYVAGEGGRGLELRAAAWKLAHSFQGSVPLHVIDDMPWASKPSEMIEMIEAIRAKSLKPKLVVIDTVARAMVGLNENDAADASEFVAVMDTLRRALGCAIALVHHTGKDEGRGVRGSNALPAAVDAAHEITAHKETKAVQLRCVRMKDAPEREEPWFFEMRVLGPSIVPYALDKRAFNLLKPSDNKASLRAISTVLARLGATTMETSVPTQVLAAELLPSAPEETPEDREENVARVVRALSVQATGNLAAYATRSGRDYHWSLAAG